MQVFQRIGQAMYQAAQATGGGEAAPSADGGEAGVEAQAESEDDVVEGEIVEEGGAS